MDGLQDRNRHRPHQDVAGANTRGPRLDHRWDQREQRAPAPPAHRDAPSVISLGRQRAQSVRRASCLVPARWWPVPPVFRFPLPSMLCDRSSAGSPQRPVSLRPSTVPHRSFGSRSNCRSCTARVQSREGEPLHRPHGPTQVSSGANRGQILRIDTTRARPIPIQGGSALVGFL